MLTGNMMIYLGIGIFSVSFVLEVIFIIVFRVNKKKMIKRIYEGYDGETYDAK